MEIPFEGGRARQAILLASLAIFALISFEAARLWLADSRSHSDQLNVMARGATLEPGNAEAWDRLGRLRQWDIENADPGLALSDFKKAVRADPLSAHYWMDLATAYESTGEIPLAQDAFDRARNAYPASAEVAWLYGNFLLRREEYAEGYAQVRRAVTTAPNLLPLAISRTWRSNQDVHVLLDRVLPPDVDSYFQALSFLAAEHQSDAALAVWQRLLGLGKTLPLPRSFPFLDELIHEGLSEDAQRVWREALVAAGMPHDEPAHQSPIWNGDFARDFVNGGLDWRWEPPRGLAIDFDAAPPVGSGRSVRLEFSGGMNLDLSQPYQFVPVEPGHTYHFQAYMRTQMISTENGVRFLIQDPFHRGAVQVLTENLTGSHPWTAAEADLTTGPETHFLLVILRRMPSRLFDNKLSGVAWIADVSLIPANAQTGQPSR